MDLGIAVKKALSAPAIGFNEIMMDKQIKHDKELILNGDPTESQKSLLEEKVKNQRLMNWIPLSIMLGVIAVSFSPYTMEYYEAGMNALTVATENLDTVTSNIEPTKELTAKIAEYGNAYFDYASDIVKTAYESINNTFIATTLTSYIAMRSIIGSVKLPIDLIQEKLDFKDKYQSENKILEMLKDYSGDDTINKYNNFDLFNGSLMFNKNFFKANVTKSNYIEKIKLLSVKAWNFVEHYPENLKMKEITSLISENQDFDIFKSKLVDSDPSLTDEEIDKLFPKNKLKDRKSDLMKLSEEALKGAKQSKLEDELILMTHLALKSKSPLEDKKTFLIDIVPMLIEIEKSVDYKNKSKINDFKKNIGLDFDFSKEIDQEILNNTIESLNDRKINRTVKKGISDIVRKDKIYRIPESTYYEKELLSITKQKIDDAVLKDLIVERKIGKAEDKLEEINGKKYNLFSHKDKRDMSEKHEENKILQMIQKGNERDYLIEVDLKEKSKNDKKLRR